MAVPVSRQPLSGFRWEPGPASPACGSDACGSDACGSDACGSDACGSDGRVRSWA
ncbi:Cys-every-fifth RiPP peptide CefA [Streptomyces sp. NPDC007264]|uniref:Cys-every-fifth RiPP peptide CefA n=1 Tax=Streptomyces sp. NPDC007264 TaxID=3364777 RepID=UPI0036DC4E8C